MPAHFKYGVVGSSDSWSSFGFWIDNLNEGTDLLPINERIIVKGLIDNETDDKKEIIKKIYQYMQDQTHYVNVAIDVGGLKSYPASYVYQNKYGDCKALTTYMKSMLKSVGIESRYTVINAGKNEERVMDNFPSQQFNHVILMIPNGNDTIWLENTANYLPFNYLGTFTQNRYALAVNGEKSELVRTPKLLPADVLVERTYTFMMSDENVCQGDIKIRLKGSDFETFRYFISDKNTQKQKEEVLAHVDIKGYSIDSWGTDNFHRDSTFIQLDVSGKVNGLVREVGSLKVINPLNISIPDLEKPDERKLDVRINYPINKSDKSIYQFNHLEAGKVQLPEEVSITSTYGQYFTSYAIENNKVIVQEKFTLFDNDISVDQYTEFYSFIQSIVTHKKKSGILIK